VSAFGGAAARGATPARGRSVVRAPSCYCLMKMRRRRLWLALLLAALAWTPLAWLAAAALVVPDDAPPRADAIVVLSGSGAYLERTRLAAQLYRAGRAPRVVLTNDDQPGGWSVERERTLYFIERAADELRRGGVPDAAITPLPEPVASTYDEAQLLRAYAARTSSRSLVVVTSAYHSRRARWTWRRAFAGSQTAFGFVSVAPGAQMPSRGGWWLSGRGWHVVAGEYVKLAYYLLRRR
jgi:uncharacterized SAM-binding protein YcdF (DUF218 family)